MVNSKEFINRLQKVMLHHQLTASQFADKIEVQRSSISHILSGRNKPSLDFVLKITNTFNDVDIYWLLNGKGNYPKEDVNDINVNTSPLLSQQSNLFDKEESRPKKNPTKQISRIVVFYNDGTFDEYTK